MTAMTAGHMADFSAASLADVLDRILDKGVVINADIAVSVVGVELLSVHIRLALASFETAARYGLEFPSGVNREAPGWQQLDSREKCPQCGKSALKEELLTSGCVWCDWAPLSIAQQNARIALTEPG